MSDINTQLVREFFELSRFSVLTHWRHADDRVRANEGTSLLFVEKALDVDIHPTPFLLQAASMSSLRRAVVEVRAWHGDKFYPSVIESSPILAHVASQEVAGQAREVFADAPFATVLVISELPASAAQRARSLQLFQDLGIDHVIEFGMILASLVSQLSRHANYAPSQTLQTLRLLKRYDLLRRQQLEFAFPLEPAPPAVDPVVETDFSSASDDASIEAEEF